MIKITFNSLSKLMNITTAHRSTYEHKAIGIKYDKTAAILRTPFLTTKIVTILSVDNIKRLEKSLMLLEEIMDTNSATWYTLPNKIDVKRSVAA
tara:strand:+ start:1392 stop:1673 length:282 start_codon:yes stop_codon:yes gene_type:complete